MKRKGIFMRSFKEEEIMKKEKFWGVSYALSATLFCLVFLVIFSAEAAEQFTAVPTGDRYDSFAVGGSISKMNVSKINVSRGANEIILYTPAYGTSTGTNQWGTEVIVSNGVVTAIAQGAGNAAIPANGFVLSGSGAGKDILEGSLAVGNKVILLNLLEDSPVTSFIDGENMDRGIDEIILYTPAYGTSTGTNQWGTEVIVSNGVVTAREQGVGNAAIPANGFVLSGHGAGKDILEGLLAVGDKVILLTLLEHSSLTGSIDGINMDRGTNQIILYTPAYGTSTGTSQWGTEVIVSNGVITAIEHGVGNAVIPVNGFVLSGNGAGKDILEGLLAVGNTVNLLTLLEHLPVTGSIDGENIDRGIDQIILYTPARGTSTGTSQWGTEVIVSNGVVTAIEQGVGNAVIPANGFVLSGNGAGEDILENLRVGDEVELITDPLKRFFDDFNYTDHTDPALFAAKWWIRGGDATGPGSPNASWRQDAVKFKVDPDNPGNVLMDLVAKTTNNDSTSVNVEIFQDRRAFLYGTYSARVNFSNLGVTTKDITVQAFFMFNHEAPYSEFDFEYVAYDPEDWWYGAGLYFSSFADYIYDGRPYAKQPRKLSYELGLLSGWHILTTQIYEGGLKYYIDDTLVASHNSAVFPVYPDTPMLMMFQHWFDTTLGSSTEEREHHFQVDWTYYIADLTLSPAEMEAVVADLRANGITHKDTIVMPSVPIPNPYGDTDSDGLYNKWEWENGFDDQNPVDGTQDTDKDGYANVYECLYETNPRDSGSFPAVTMYVNASSPDNGDGSASNPYNTIQDALDAASYTDYAIIQVADGTYTGQGDIIANFKGKTAMLVSKNGPEQCILDGEDTRRGFFLNATETSATLIKGFTIQNCRANLGAGMFLGAGAEARIQNCIIINNNANSHGGGLQVDSCSPLFENCVIAFNSAPANGGGISCAAATPTFRNCTIIDNQASCGGALLSWISTPVIVNSILWNNTPDEISGQGVTVTYSDVEGGYTGTGNLNTAPQLSATTPYRLAYNSPCIDAGLNANLPLYDIDGQARVYGSGVDMGADEFEDTTPPTGAILIAAGAAYTSATSVTLTLSAADTGSGMGSGAQMMFSNNGSSWSSAEAYGTTKSWTLTTGSGTKTVYVKFKDVAGNWSNAVSDTIILDSTPPTATPVVTDDGIYTASATLFHATWTQPCADSESGIAGYKVAIGTTVGGTNVLNWTDPSLPGEVIASVTLTEGATYYFTVRAKNGAGLYSTAGNSDGITVDTTAPTGTILINGGNASTTSTSVALYLSATDRGSGMGGGAEMKFSNDNVNWTSRSHPWTLTSGNGTKTVYAKFKDAAGNWSTASIKDTIILDTAAPAITHTRIASAPKNKDIVFTATVTDTDSGVKEVTIYWRKWIMRLLWWEWSDLRNSSMVSQGSGVYKATLTASQVEDRKIKYYIKAVDKAGMTKSTSEYIISRY